MEERIRKENEIIKGNQMILYRNLKYQKLFDDVCTLLASEKGDNSPDAYACANSLIELAVTYGFKGNLWHCFLAFCMANHENAYSTSCEIKGPVGGTLNVLAAHDFRLMRKLFSSDIAVLDEESGGIWELMKNYESTSEESRVFNRRIRNRIVELAAALERTEDDTAFQDTVTEFYREFGVGKFGLNKAFHIEGRAANNVLLFGDSGTGKSSSIKAILNKYYDRGLRMIEVYKHQFRSLSDVLEQIKDRNYKFIIYMDDLSFEEYEIEYKYLKAIIEGGLGIKPQNVLIYATSNRRHLIREKFSDKRELDDELHVNDTVQEKLSLVARFGVTIYYGSPDKKEFQKIVKVLADKYHVEIPEEELYLEANKWELSHGGLSGRTAAQFITHLLGKLKLEE